MPSQNLPFDTARTFLEKGLLLDQSGSPENSPELFDEVIDLQQSLLDAFGLPPSRRNELLAQGFFMEKHSEVEEGDAQRLLDNLDEERVRFLDRSVLTPLERMRLGREQKEEG